GRDGEVVEGHGVVAAARVDHQLGRPLGGAGHAVDAVAQAAVGQPVRHDRVGRCGAVHLHRDGPTALDLVAARACIHDHLVGRIVQHLDGVVARTAAYGHGTAGPRIEEVDGLARRADQFAARPVRVQGDLVVARTEHELPMRHGQVVGDGFQVDVADYAT